METNYKTRIKELLFSRKLYAFAHESHRFVKASVASIVGFIWLKNYESDKFKLFNAETI